jgi:translation initiation factor 1
MSSMRKGAAGGLVYLTEGGRMCPVCRQAVSACTCRAAAQAVPAGDGVVRVSRETKGRGGKAVTLVRGLRLDAAALAAVGKRLRSACGSGGTIKDDVVEVQGETMSSV